MLITAWNAAYTSNQVNDARGLETYLDYLSDPNLRYFNTPTNGGATRTSSSLVEQDPAGCPAISDSDLLDE